MTSFIAGLTPWLVNSAVTALGEGASLDNGGSSEAADMSKPKLAQVISFEGLEPPVGHETGPRRIYVCDKANSAELFLSAQAAEELISSILSKQHSAEKRVVTSRWNGSLVKLSGWKINTVALCSGKKFRDVMGSRDGCDRRPSLPLPRFGILCRAAAAPPRGT